MRIHFKRFRLAGWGAVLLGAVLVGGKAIAAEELRIGFVVPLTGASAQVGKDMQNGFNLYLEEQHSNFSGAQVKVIYEDSQAIPATAVAKAQKLIDQDQVHLIIGGFLATEGYALAPVADRGQIPYIAPVASADNLT